MFKVNRDSDLVAEVEETAALPGRISDVEK
jgi:hypothetical protein